MGGGRHRPRTAGSTTSQPNRHTRLRERPIGGALSLHLRRSPARHHDQPFPSVAQSGGHVPARRRVSAWSIGSPSRVVPAAASTSKPSCDWAAIRRATARLGSPAPVTTATIGPSRGPGVGGRYNTDAAERCAVSRNRCDPCVVPRGAVARPRRCRWRRRSRSPAAPGRRGGLRTSAEPRSHAPPPRGAVAPARRRPSTQPPAGLASADAIRTRAG